MTEETKKRSELFQLTVEGIKRTFDFDTPPKDFSDGEISDHIVRLRQVQSLLEAREKLLTETLKARYNHQIALLGGDETLKIEGDETHGLMISNVTQKRFDSEAVKAEMGEEWWEEHCKSVSFTQARVIKG